MRPILRVFSVRKKLIMRMIDDPDKDKKTKMLKQIGYHTPFKVSIKILIEL